MIIQCIWVHRYGERSPAILLSIHVHAFIVSVSLAISCSVRANESDRNCIFAQRRQILSLNSAKLFVYWITHFISFIIWLLIFPFLWRSQLNVYLFRRLRPVKRCHCSQIKQTKHLKRILFDHLFVLSDCILFFLFIK